MPNFSYTLWLYKFIIYNLNHLISTEKIYQSLYGILSYFKVVAVSNRKWKTSLMMNVSTGKTYHCKKWKTKCDCLKLKTFRLLGLIYPLMTIAEDMGVRRFFSRGGQNRVPGRGQRYFYNNFAHFSISKEIKIQWGAFSPLAFMRGRPWQRNKIAVFSWFMFKLKYILWIFPLL